MTNGRYGITSIQGEERKNETEANPEKECRKEEASMVNSKSAPKNYENIMRTHSLAQFLL